MNKLTTTLQACSYKTGVFFSTLALAPRAFAQESVFGPVPNVTGNGGDGDIRTAVLNLLKTILSYLALLAIIYIVYAGIRLMVSRGNEEAVAEGRKTIIYVLVGLVVIIFARFIVSIATDIILEGSGA